jgi:hypothetical protein
LASQRTHGLHNHSLQCFEVSDAFLFN